MNITPKPTKSGTTTLLIVFSTASLENNSLMPIDNSPEKAGKIAAYPTAAGIVAITAITGEKNVKTIITREAIIKGVLLIILLVAMKPAVPEIGTEPTEANNPLKS